jgi:hypothetical protein
MNNAPTPRLRWPLYVLLLLVFSQLALLIALWRADIIAQDFYPLYLGAELLRAGQSPYGPAATELLIERWDVVHPFPQAGIAYPLPLLVLFVPLTFLSFPLASALWSMLSFLSTLPTGRIAALRIPPSLYYWPAFFGLVVGQASLMWLGLCLILLLAIRDRRLCLLGLCIALLPLKPQSGILFALVGVIWAWQHARRALLWAFGFGGALATLSFFVQPGWFIAWVDQIILYRQIITPLWLWPWLIVLVLCSWGLPWWARLMIVQVLLFPVVRQSYGADPYTLLPLLLVWCAIGGRLAIGGVALSWLWPIAFVAEMSNYVSDLFLLLPLACACAWRTWQAYQRGTLYLAFGGQRLLTTHSAVE